jgi:transcriptional regulator with XRE-family HTH domain
MEPLRVFGERVRKLRTERRLSQEELAERSGLHRNYVGGVERGERNLSLVNLLYIARGLDIAASDLLVEFTKARLRALRQRP